MKAIKSKD